MREKRIKTPAEYIFNGINFQAVINLQAKLGNKLKQKTLKHILKQWLKQYILTMQLKPQAEQPGPAIQVSDWPSLSGPNR